MSYVTFVDNIEILNNIHEALHKPKWTTSTVIEEVQELGRSDTCEITTILHREETDMN